MKPLNLLTYNRLSLLQFFIPFGKIEKNQWVSFIAIPVLLMILTAVSADTASASSGNRFKDKPDRSDMYHRHTVKHVILLAEAENNADEFDWDDEDFDFEDEEALASQLRDPLAPWNKAMFYINDRFYYWMLKPLAQGYKAVTPTPVRSSVSNFFDNLAAPLRMISCMLQGKGEAAGGELASFMVNSTMGFLGIFDVTEFYPELNPKEEDLGQVLGVWGMGNGFYIVWPFWGPSTLRDTVGLVGDRFLNPVTYVDPIAASTGISGFEMINNTSFRIGDYESLKDAAIIPYEAFRDAYIQLRERDISE